MPKPRREGKTGPRREANATEMKRMALETELRASEGERLKNLGNDLFRQGKYAEAAAIYNQAVNTFGTQPVYMCNLAATYLKLEDYEMAERAALLALVHDPRMVKARFRRGIARKENHKFKAAKADFETVIREDPNCAEAKAELAAVNLLLCEIDGEQLEDNSDESTDYEFPAPDTPPRDPLPMWLASASDSEDSSDSDSGDIHEDSEHVGNGIPCKHHNRKPLGCAKGASCVYSHAPDARSVPDKEGRNVCLYFLMGSCKFGDRCLYSHSKGELPDLWGADLRKHEIREMITENERSIEERRMFSKYMGKGPLASDTLMALKRATDKAKEEKALKMALAEFMYDLLGEEPPTTAPPAPAPFIMHLTLNKSTDIPRAAVTGLRERMEVSRAKSATKARGMLSSPALRGVFVTDAGITKNTGLLAQLAKYVRGGGTVVIGGSFRLFASSKQTDVPDAQLVEFFRNGWGVAWQPAGRTEGSLNLNTQHARGGVDGLPPSCSVKGLSLRDVRVEDALYLSSAPTSSDLVETSIVFSQLEKGYLGFVGDAGAESATTEIIAAMFGLSPS
ncbi:hypothetical protein B0H15DRAFT_847785 [Mycena belliarum]|uniref:C3H1-type domain-containing protein n=1 Tax=Mycena belliarum TaxID=1033014 RepID=A0AAD6U0Q7_9AGAR|nr:hypothetical protein B0H15DRAFT_847785 [Mycena belliae]